MKGYPLLATALAAVKRNPMTTPELSRAMACGYVTTMRLVTELRDSCLIGKVGDRRIRGRDVAVYGFLGGEASIVGRAQTQKFLHVWNAFLEPECADIAAQELGLMSANYLRRTLRLLRELKLCRIAGWQSRGRGDPMMIFAIGDGRDALRPPPMSNAEACQLWAKRHREREIYAALTWRLAA